MISLINYPGIKKLVIKTNITQLNVRNQTFLENNIKS